MIHLWPPGCTWLRPVKFYVESCSWGHWPPLSYHSGAISVQQHIGTGAPCTRRASSCLPAGQAHPLGARLPLSPGTLRQHWVGSYWTGGWKCYRSAGAEPFAVLGHFRKIKLTRTCWHQELCCLQRSVTSCSPALSVAAMCQRRASWAPTFHCHPWPRGDSSVTAPMS